MTSKYKKICIIVTDAVSFNFLMKGQLEYLVSLNKYEITLVSGGEIEQLEILNDRGVGAHKYIPFARKIDLGSDLLSFVRLFIYFLFNRFDIVVYSTPKALLIGSICSFITLQKKRVAIVRGRVYENYRGKKRRFFELLDKFSLHISTNSLFISNSLRDKYVSEGIVSREASKVLLNGSSNGLDSKWAKEPLDERKIQDLKASVDFNENDFIAVSVGRICIEKGIVELEKVFLQLEKYPRFRLILVGRLEDQVAANIIDRLCKFANFYYFDQVSDVRYFFEIADVHLFLSHREGFGNVAIEAAAFKVPTLAYNVVGVKDSVSHGVSGKLFDFSNTNGIAQEIEAYLISGDCPIVDFPECSDWATRNFNSLDIWNAYDQEFSQ